MSDTTNQNDAIDLLRRLVSTFRNCPFCERQTIGHHAPDCEFLTVTMGEPSAPAAAPEPDYLCICGEATMLPCPVHPKLAAAPERCPTCGSDDKTIHRAYQCGNTDCICINSAAQHDCFDPWHSAAEQPANPLLIANL